MGLFLVMNDDINELLVKVEISKRNGKVTQHLPAGGQFPLPVPAAALEKWWR
jgi:hypothetical protein